MQVTPPIIGKHDAAQFAVSGKVETGIGGKHQQTSHIPPADLLLQEMNIRQSVNCQLAASGAA